MSKYTQMVAVINLKQITNAELTTLKNTGLDTMLANNEFEEIEIDGVVKTPEQQVEMLKDAITALLTV